MSDLLALITIIAWPVIPLFWIPMHLFSAFFKEHRLLPYILPLVTWLPLAYLLYQNRGLLLAARVDIPAVVRAAGLVLLTGGTLLHIWTIALLGIRRITGVPEVSGRSQDGVERGGAFAVVRHPTYLAHTLMFSGVFYFSGVIAAGVIAVFDFAVVMAFIIPLEEKELLDRFGDEYRNYQKEVPAFFPRLTSLQKRRRTKEQQ